MIFQFFRLMDSSPNEDARIRKENLKKVAVNAQLTAFVSFSEALGFAMVFVITLVTNSKTTAKVLFRFLEYIFLPYAFLKNTEENKNQVVRYGWLNFFCNTFKVCSISHPCRQSNDVVLLNQIENYSKDDIFTISKSIVPKNVNEHDVHSEKLSKSQCNLHVPFNETASSSNGDDTQSKTIHCAIPTFESTSKVAEWLDLKDRILNKRSAMVKELILSTNDELRYMSKFLRFIEIEHSRNETQYLHETPTVDINIVLNRVERLLYLGNQQERVDLRLNILQELTQHIDDEDTFKSILSDLIDMEESFLDNECENN